MDRQECITELNHFLLFIQQQPSARRSQERTKKMVEAIEFALKELAKEADHG